MELWWNKNKNKSLKKSSKAVEMQAQILLRTISNIFKRQFNLGSLSHFYNSLRFFNILDQKS